jgi:hypothetical protein
MYTKSHDHYSHCTIKTPWRSAVTSYRPGDEGTWNLSDHETYTEFMRDLDAEILTIHRKLVHWLIYKQQIQFRYGTLSTRLQ